MILLFVFTRFLKICTSHQSNAPLFTQPLSYLLWRPSFRSCTNFKKNLNFWVFLCSSFGRQSSQNCGWAGSEPYVPLHITESPYFFFSFWYSGRSNILSFVSTDSKSALVQSWMLSTQIFREHWRFEAIESHSVSFYTRLIGIKLVSFQCFVIYVSLL